MKFETFTDDELYFWARHHTAYLKELINFCKCNGKKEIAFVAIKSPHIDPALLLSLLREGKEIINRPNSYKSWDGDWWLFTEGIKNPSIPEIAQNPTYGHALSLLCGCNVIDYLHREQVYEAQLQALQQSGEFVSPHVARQLAPPRPKPASIREAFAPYVKAKERATLPESPYETKEWIDSGW